MNTGDPYDFAVFTLGKKWRKYREAVGFSLDDLARLSGVAKSTLSKIENGKGNPSLRTILRVADALDQTPGTLVTLWT